jgi:hypothetical protein
MYSYFLPHTLLETRGGLPCGTNQDASRGMAIARWPQHAELFKRKKDDGRSDAALIAIVSLMRAGKLK